MNILFMADVLANPDSGAAGTEYQTIQALRGLGHEVDAVWSDELSHKIRHGNLHYLIELPLSYEKTMLAKMRRRHYDVVHVNQPHGYRAAKSLMQTSVRCVFIHRSHGLEMRVERDLSPWRIRYGQGDERSSLRKLVSRSMTAALAYNNRCIARFADGHIVSASQCRDFLREEMAVPAERIAVIPQAPPGLFVERPVAPMTADRLTRVLYVGQYAFVKAPVVTAQVFNQLSQANEQLRFTWVCAREHHAQVRQLLKPRALERTTLLDWMPQDKLIRVYDGHGVFLLPSFFEGFGKVFLEAMSRGLCVVAADNGGARDIITHGLNGTLSPTGCADTMAVQCLRLVESPTLAFAMSESAAECARAYTWKRVARETASFYRNRLDARSHEQSAAPC